MSYNLKDEDFIRQFMEDANKQQQSDILKLHQKPKETDLDIQL